MARLKTINISGDAYFVTSKIVSGLNLFFYNTFCQIIIDNLNFYRKSKVFKILGYVIMLNHLHMIIWPQGKYTISDIMMNFKEFTAKQIIKTLEDSQDREALAPRPELAGKVFKQTGLGTCHSLSEAPAPRENQAPRPELASDFSARRGRLAFSGWLNELNSETYPSRFLAYFKEQAKNIKGQSCRVWMSRNWIENVYSEKFLSQKLDYIHANPVKAGLVKDPIDWLYSSVRNYYLNDHSLIKIDSI